jgi:hypothetical protein
VVEQEGAWARGGVVGEVAGRQVQAVQLPGHAEAKAKAKAAAAGEGVAGGAGRACSRWRSGSPCMAQPSASLACHCCRKRCASARSGAAASATRIVPCEACAPTSCAAMPSRSSSASRAKASREARRSSSLRESSPPDGCAMPTCERRREKGGQ